MSRKKRVGVDLKILKAHIKRVHGTHKEFLAAHPEIGVSELTFRKYMTYGVPYKTDEICARILVDEWKAPEEAAHITELKQHLEQTA